MKPFPQYDFPVSIRKQIWEEEPQVAPFYQDIFDVRLNFAISIMFVPNIAQTIKPGWNPELPENIDKITTTLEARIVTVAFSQYTVTPNVELAGTDMSFQRGSLEDFVSGTLFFVTPSEFETFAIELSDLAEERPAVYDTLKLSEIKNLNFVKFILTKIVVSKYFSKENLSLLGR